MTVPSGDVFRSSFPFDTRRQRLLSKGIRVLSQPQPQWLAQGRIRVGSWISSYNIATVRFWQRDDNMQSTGKLPGSATWPRLVGMVGASLCLGGIAWSAIWNYSHRDYADAVKYELRLPWPPRLMVFVGLALLIIIAVRVGIRLMRRSLRK